MRCSERCVIADLCGNNRVIPIGMNGPPPARVGDRERTTASPHLGLTSLSDATHENGHRFALLDEGAGRRVTVAHQNKLGIN